MMPKILTAEQHAPVYITEAQQDILDTIDNINASIETVSKISEDVLLDQLKQTTEINDLRARISVLG